MIKRNPKAIEALELRLSGLTYREIGKQLGISHQRAQQIIRPPAPIYNFVKTRAESDCEECGLFIYNGHVHHKVSTGITRQQYDSPDNLEYLCVSCHQKKHSGDKTLRRQSGNLPDCLCVRCGRRWAPRIKHPKCCPQCKRYDWRDVPMSPNKKLVLAVAKGFNTGE